MKFMKNKQQNSSKIIYTYKNTYTQAQNNIITIIRRAVTMKTLLGYKTEPNYFYYMINVDIAEICEKHL